MRGNLDNKTIIIRNATTHNLKNISVDIPKNRFVVVTGVSGCGKSSLVFDTIYTESQRQLIETFSSFARRRLPKLSKPDVEEISNLSTSIIINQERMGTSMRSTVGTASELYTYLRLLFSRCGDEFIGPSFMFGFNHPLGMCPECRGIGQVFRLDIDKLIDREKTLREGAITHPHYKVDTWNHRELLGINMFDADKKLKDFTDDEMRTLLYAESIPVKREHGHTVYSKYFEGVVTKLERIEFGKADFESEPAQGIGKEYFIYRDCEACGGTRINEKARSVKVAGKTIPELVNLELTELDAFIAGVEGDIARPIVSKMRQLISYLIDIGVGYISLNRPVATLSGGESQRLKMARQLDCNLVDLMYILDEPSIGLHPRDTRNLVEMLYRLRDKGNSVLVVEHDPDIIMSADYVVDIGPGAGSYGGEIIYTGTPEGLLKSEGLTGQYLGKNDGNRFYRKPWSDFFPVNNATVHNLKNISTRIPKGVLTCVTGVAGSGKSSLVHDVFLRDNPEAVVVDQSPIGRSSRSNPVTYIGIFDLIRKEFATANGVDSGLFSFNSKGACPKCKGLGEISVEMSFLDEVKIPCDECGGKRYTNEVLELKYRGSSIFDVLNLTVQQGLKLFENTKIYRKLDLLNEVGLGYLKLGQPLSTLSGGERQRIKLVSELHKKGNIYVLDEPTTGLHPADVERLIAIIQRLVKNDNTVVVIEHNLDVIKHADWIIDLGPEGGAKGGYILFEGVPEDLVKSGKGFTGQYLQQKLNSGR